MQLPDAAGQVHELQQHEAAKLTGPLLLDPSASGRALLLLFEMKQSNDERNDL